MLLACCVVWPIAVQGSLLTPAPSAPTPDILPVNHTPDVLLRSTRAIRRTDVARSLQPVDRDAQFVSTPPPALQHNDVIEETVVESHRSADTDSRAVSHSDTQAPAASDSNDAAGPVQSSGNADVGNGLSSSSSLHPATESSTLTGAPSLRNGHVGPARLPASPAQASPESRPVLRPAQTTALAMLITQGPIGSPSTAGDPPVHPPPTAGSGDQAIPVLKETGGGDSETLTDTAGPPSTVSQPLPPPGTLTSVSSTLTKMAEAQPGPTASILLRASSSSTTRATRASTKTPLPERNATTTAQTSSGGAASTGSFAPGE